MLLYSVKLVLIALLLLGAVISDIKIYRIKNSITLTFALIGVIINTAAFGINGLFETISGMILPFLLLLILYASRMLGAGDIKLFCSIGAIMGLHYVLWDMAFSFMAGGIAAFIIILIQKNGVERLRYLFNYLRSCFLTLSILPYSDFSNKDDGTKMRFSYAIFLGTVAYQIIS